MGERCASGRCRFALSVLVLACLASWAAPASAADPTVAKPDALADRAREAQAAGRCNEAIPLFEELINRQSTPGIRLPYGDDVRHRAQWSIGRCKFESRDYAGALAAFRDARKFRIYADCGNAYLEWEYRQSFHEALTLEHLGRPAEAIDLYAHAARYTSDGGPAAAERLFDLYAASGQLADLRRIASGNSQQRPIEGIAYRFRVIDLEGNKAWSELVQELRSRRRPGTRQVAEALGRHGDETVPLLLAEVDKGKTTWPDVGIWRALGLAATPRTVGAIVARARREPAMPALAALVAGLRLAGAAGQTALAQLAAGATDKLRSVLDRPAKDDGAPKKDKVTFPPLPAKQPLPVSIAPPPPIEPR